MRISNSILVIIFSLFLVSCGGSKYSVEKFCQLSNITNLNGSYENKFKSQSDSLYSQTNGELSRSLGVYVDSIQLIDLKFSSQNITITIHTDSGLQEKSYKGKFKENYFEVYVNKKIAPIPFIYFGWNWERVRIGLDEGENLLIQYWQNNFGWILFGSAGGSEDKEYKFRRIKD